MLLNLSRMRKYLNQGGDFVNEELINQALLANQQPSGLRLQEIMAKAPGTAAADPDETAAC